MSDRVGRLGAFCALIPLADRAGAERVFAGWRERDHSPFAAVEGTHFARFVVLGELRREVARQPDDALPAPYLLFSAFFDGDAEPWLAALGAAAPDDAAEAWRHCHGFPGGPVERPHAFRRWLLEHRVPATAVFAASPEATVADVRAALALRRDLRALAFDPRTSLETFTAFAREHVP